MPQSCDMWTTSVSQVHLPCSEVNSTINPWKSKNHNNLKKWQRYCTADNNMVVVLFYRHNANFGTSPTQCVERILFHISGTYAVVVNSTDYRSADTQCWQRVPWNETVCGNDNNLHSLLRVPSIQILSHWRALRQRPRICISGTLNKE